MSYARQIVCYHCVSYPISDCLHCSLLCSLLTSLTCSASAHAPPLQASADPRDELGKTFATICDGGSKITAENLAKMAKELGESLTEEDLEEWIEEADTDGDGAVSEEEFFAVMKKG